MVDQKNDQSMIDEGIAAQQALLADADPSLTDAAEVAKALNVDPNVGLDDEEARRRREQFGPNELTQAPPVPKWKKFLQQFQDPLVYLLFAATVISVIAWFIERANTIRRDCDRADLDRQCRTGVYSGGQSRGCR